MDTSSTAAAPATPTPARDVAVALEGVTRLLRRMVSPEGMSLTAVATLATLERQGSRRLTELAVSEGVSQPAMTQLISRLEAEALVRREADPNDGRVVRVRLTDAGRAELTRRREIRTQRLAGLLARLDQDQQTALAAAVPAFEALTRLETE
jgi:DNA-binding MarR family transcriptional regulator